MNVRITSNQDVEITGMPDNWRWKNEIPQPGWQWISVNYNTLDGAKIYEKNVDVVYTTSKGVMYRDAEHNVYDDWGVPDTLPDDHPCASDVASAQEMLRKNPELLLNGMLELDESLPDNTLRVSDTKLSELQQVTLPAPDDQYVAEVYKIPGADIAWGKKVDTSRRLGHIEVHIESVLISPSDLTKALQRAIVRESKIDGMYFKYLVEHPNLEEIPIGETIPTYDLSKFGE